VPYRVRSAFHVEAAERVADLAAARRQIDVAVHLLQIRWDIGELKVRTLECVPQLRIERADVVTAVCQVAGRQAAERVVAGHPVEDAGVRVLGPVVSYLARKQRRLAQARPVGLNIRQGVSSVHALVEGGKLRAELVRDLSRDVVSDCLVDRLLLEPCVDAGVTKRHGAIGGGPLRVVSQVDPDAIATDRASEIEDRLPIRHLVGGRGEVLGDRLVRRGQAELWPQPALQPVGREIEASASVPVVAAALRDCADHPSNGGAVFGAVSARLDLHLLDEFGRHRFVGVHRQGVRVAGETAGTRVDEPVGIDGLQGSEAQIRLIDAIDDVTVVSAAGAVNLNASAA
jgi:hypothetical protein